MKYAICPCGCGLTIEIVGEDKNYYLGRIIVSGSRGFTVGNSHDILKTSNWIIKSSPENTGLEE